MTHEDADERNGTDRRDDATRRALGEIQHTNPHTGNAFGDTVTFDRGRTVAADGGERDPSTARDAPAPEGDDPEDAEDGTGEGDATPLRDVDHTPPAEADGANNVYERGHEGREEDA